MLDNTEWDNLADVLMPEDFYRAEHQMIFAVMSKQSETNKPIDVVTLLEALNSLDQLEAVGGIDYLSELSGNARGQQIFCTTQISSAIARFCAALFRPQILSPTLATTPAANASKIFSTKPNSASLILQTSGPKTQGLYQ